MSASPPLLLAGHFAWTLGPGLVLLKRALALLESPGKLESSDWLMFQLGKHLHHREDLGSHKEKRCIKISKYFQVKPKASAFLMKIDSFVF